MKYIIERDLFMSKVEGFINEKFREGYKLHSMVVTETEHKQSNTGGKVSVASKATLVFEKID